MDLGNENTGHENTGHDKSRHSEDPRRRLRVVFESSGLTLEELWLKYFALGGMMELFDMDAYLYGASDLPPLEQDILAQSLEELRA
jgi:hypothetical protein